MHAGLRRDLRRMKVSRMRDCAALPRRNDIPRRKFEGRRMPPRWLPSPRRSPQRVCVRRRGGCWDNQSHRAESVFDLSETSKADFSAEPRETAKKLRFESPGSIASCDRIKRNLEPSSEASQF